MYIFLRGRQSNICRLCLSNGQYSERVLSYYHKYSGSIIYSQQKLFYRIDDGNIDYTFTEDLLKNGSPDNHSYF